MAVPDAPGGRNTPPEPSLRAGAPFSFQEIVGDSAALASAREAARMIARGSLATVLIVGETGTGKELFARGIHAEGSTGSSPFVAVNCAAIPEALLESELFGHEAGAFTGARTRKMGLMEFAGCGTLFLDELHHLPTMLQPKLLRALEERRMRRLGGSDEISIACRIVAATNVAIEEAVDDGTFREDLFYRLNVMRVDVPALRERPEDIEPIALHFLATIARGQRQPAKGLTAEAVAVLQAHRWPGNVRELRNVMERAAVLSGAAPMVELSHLLIQQRTNRSALGTTTGEGRAGDIAIPPEGKTLAAIEREAALLTLQLAKGNRTHAARMLGISRPTLARLLRETAAPALDLT